MPTAVAWVGFSLAFVGLSVYPHNISKTATARITKVDVEINVPPSHENPFI